MGAKPKVDALDVRTLARELLGTDWVDISPVRTEGMETHAYRVASGDRACCLRIGRSAKGFGKDRWAHRMLGDRLPVPRIWEIGQLDHDRAFCLSEWMPGVTVQDLAADEVERVMPAVFEAWSIVANCDISNVAGCGDFDPETGVAPSTTWRGWLRRAAEEVQSRDGRR